MRPLGAADPKTIGGYQLLGVLGSGGMGRVYLGASRTGRRVAIKVIRPDLAEDPVFRDRFTREVAAAGRVSPLFTALVVDSDTEAAAPWLATTYIEGVSLDRHVLDDGKMGIDDVLSLAAGLGEALTSIHTAGLVHRDLKPSNILLNDSGPHIIDFGLALGNEQTRLTTSRVVGTPAYMAPERLRGEAAGPPSDVFSLGATLVFAATGRDLVDDANVYEQVLQIAEGRFNLTDVPPRLRALVIRCVSFHPEDRPTAAELTRFVVALGTVTPGLSVEDVTVKISTKHRAEARAAGIPIRTTPRRNVDPDGVPTDDQAADDVTPDESRAAQGLDDDPAGAQAVVSGSGVGASTDTTVGGLVFGGFAASAAVPNAAAPSAVAPGTARSGRLRAVIAPRSPYEGQTSGVSVAWSQAAAGAGADGPMTGGPVVGGPIAGGPMAGGRVAGGPVVAGTPLGAGSAGADPGDDWRARHPSDPDFNGPPFYLQPLRPRWSRRTLITAGGAAAAVVATGGVLAAVELAAHQRPGSVGVNKPQVPSTPGPLVGSTGPAATSNTVIAGDVLWTASSGAGPLTTQPQNLPGGRRVLASPGGVIVALQDQNREVVALNATGKKLWSKPQVSSNAAMWLWGNGILVSDGAWLALYDLASGRQRFHVQPASLASKAIGRSHGVLRVTGLALNSTTAYVGLGSAMLAIDRAGKPRHTWQVGDRLAETPETPTAASDRWVVTQTVGLLSSLNVYPAKNELPTLQQTYPPLQFNIDGTTNAAAASPGTTTDPAVRFAEARIVDGYVVARIERDVRAFAISDGSALMHEAEPGPVHAIAPINSSILVASTSISKYDILTGNRQWQAAIPALRLAVISQPGQATVVVAATVGGVTGLDAHGRVLWYAHLPVSLATASPSGITIGPHAAYVTFDLPAGSDVGLPDVAAIALDDKAHR